MRYSLACLLALLPLVAFGQSSTVTWTFDGTASGQAWKAAYAPAPGVADLKWSEGVQKQALTIEDKPVTYAVPAAFCTSATLSFYYRIPAEPADPQAKQAFINRLEILRLGGRSLIYENRRLVWTDPQRSGKSWIPRHSFLSPDQFTLLEIGWSATEGCWLFADGTAVCLMEDWSAEKPAGDTAPLTLLAGTFDEMRLESDASASGTRYKGILARERFENGLSEAWADANRAVGARLIEGYNGSKQAVATAVKGGPYFALSLPFGYYRVTEDMYLCGAFYSTEVQFQALLPRIWPKDVKESPNSWLQWSGDAGAWRAERIPLLRWKVKPGWIMEGMAVGSAGPAERYVALDDVCLVRGEDTEPPAKVEGLKTTLKDDAVLLNWQPAADNICTAGYIIYWSNVPALKFTETEVAGKTPAREFKHDMQLHGGAYYYAVAAVDVFGNTGKPSEIMKIDVPH